MRTIRWWRWRLRRAERGVGDDFVEVIATDDREDVASWFEVSLPDGLTITVRPGFDEDELVRLVRTLERAC